MIACFKMSLRSQIFYSLHSKEQIPFSTRHLISFNASIYDVFNFKATKTQFELKFFKIRLIIFLMSKLVKMDVLMLCHLKVKYRIARE